MRAKHLLLPVLLMSAICLQANDNLFPNLEQLPPAAIMPRMATLGVNQDGNLLVNGKIRHLLGTQCGIQMLRSEFAPTSGYPANLKWIYEELLNYNNAQRLGFDTLEIFVTAGWLKNRLPGYQLNFRDADDGKMVGQIINNGLPVLVDYTCFPWTHGTLTQPKWRQYVPAEVINEYNTGEGNHWVPYNIFHPEGKKLYQTYWEHGLAEIKTGNNPIYAYELFNEPGYDDPSQYNRGKFAAFLAAKYASVDKMNKIWRSNYASFAAASAFKRKTENPGLYVDWSKFMEQGMTELAKLGRETIKNKDPQAKICYQILSTPSYRALPNTNVNIYEINKFMDVISTSTSGGIFTSTPFATEPAITVEAPSNLGTVGDGILERHFFRNCATGKPMHNPECYAGTSATDNANIVWLDMLRGSDITYMFMWSKRAWEWQPKGSPEGGRKVAEKFPYTLANPYAISPQALKGLSEGKLEVIELADLFVPRQRNISREIAVMLSFATERYGAAVGYSQRNEIRGYGAALEFAHYAIDVITEEQIPEPKQKPYRAIIAVGAENTLDTTQPALAEFVKNGGVLISARSAMRFDEYGNSPRINLFKNLKITQDANAKQAELELKIERPDNLPGRILGRQDFSVAAGPDWDVLGTINQTPALLHRTYGKGHLYLIVPQLQDYAVAAVLGAILQRHNIHPTLDLRRVPQNDMAINIEAHTVRRADLTATFLMNYDKYNKLTELAVPAGTECVIDIRQKEQLPQVNGRARFMIRANDRAILVWGPKNELQKRFGKFTAVTSDILQQRFAAAEKERIARQEELARQANRYRINSALTEPLDLRSFVNTGFTDQVPGDGKGGWTDQGRDNCLEGAPWGIIDALGVPCEFIRYDQNDNRTCIILKNQTMSAKLPTEIKGIPVHRKVANLFFFHTAAWGKDGMEIMKYRIRYTSGKNIEIPVRFNRDIGDWWLMASPEMKRQVAWKNSDNRGIYLMPWNNPNPDDEIAELDIISTETKAIPIVIGITAERFDPQQAVREWKVPAKARGWGNLKASVNGNMTTAEISTQTSAWAGVQMTYTTPIQITPDDQRQGILEIELNGGANIFGTHMGGQQLQLCLGTEKKGMVTKFAPIQMTPDSDPGTVQRAELPLHQLQFTQPLPLDVDMVAIQFRGQPSAGIQIGKISLIKRKNTATTK